MILSDRELRERGPSIMEPYDEEMIQPASIDVRLGESFVMFKGSFVDPLDPDRQGNPIPFDVSMKSKNPWTPIDPGEFLLGVTLESVKVPTDLAARLEGRSSLGRLGLLTHATAGFIDPGFEGQITLELHNLSNSTIVLTPGMRIGQLCFFQTSSPATKPYGDPSYRSRYQGQTGATVSRYHIGEVMP